MSGTTTSSVLSSASRMIGAALEMVQDRVELFAIEVQEEKYRMAAVVLGALAVGAFGLMALLLLTCAVILMFWETAKIPAFLVLGLLYLFAASWSWHKLHLCIQLARPFASTLGELKKDKACCSSVR